MIRRIGSIHARRLTVTSIFSPGQPNGRGWGIRSRSSAIMGDEGTEPVSVVYIALPIALLLLMLLRPQGLLGQRI